MRELLALAAFLAVAVGERCIGAGMFNAQFNKCYHYVSSSQTYAEAVEVCRGIGGRLVCIHNAFEQALVFGNAKKLLGTSNYWIGLTDLEEPGTWEWADEVASSYRNWDTGYPLNSTSLRCGGAKVKTGRWFNEDCETVKLDFVCEVETEADTPNTDCPNGGNVFGGRSCFYFFDSMQERSAAEATCADFQGILASLETEDKQNFVYGEAQGKNFRDDYWIGLKQDNLSQWVWSDSARFAYNNWEKDFPMMDMGMNCGAMHASSGKWYNTFCEQNPRVFVCEVTSPLAPPTTVPPSTTPWPIHKGNWSYFGPTNSWYKMMHLADYYYTDWQDIRADCEYQDGDLASIHSKEENDFIARLVEVDSDAWVSWIGLESKTGTTWFWSDNTPLDYLNWSGGKPNDGAEALCAVIYADGTWLNYDCNNLTFSAICKRSNDAAEQVRLRRLRQIRRKQRELLEKYSQA